MAYLIVFFGAGIGGAMRHGVNVGAAKLFGLNFPFGTLIVNVVGSFMIGLLAGYFRGLTDTVVSRLIDIWMSFPPVLLSIVLAAAVGAGLGSVVLAIIVIDWTRFARVVRAETQLQRQLDYVAAARVAGLRRGRTLFAEILPNVLPLIVTLLTVEMGIAVIVEAILSFLGVGLPLTEPSLGLLIANGFEYMLSGKYWISFYPGVALLATIMSINLVGDRLRDVLNPRLER